jgi:hypothetical protein
MAVEPPAGLLEQVRSLSRAEGVAVPAIIEYALVSFFDRT